MNLNHVEITDLHQPNVYSMNARPTEGTNVTLSCNDIDG